MKSEKLTPELGGRLRRTAVLVATFTATQGEHEVLSAPGGNRRTDPQIHPVARMSPWPAASNLGLPFLKIEAQAGCTQAGETFPRGGGRGLKREGGLRNQPSQSLGKTPREATRHRPQQHLARALVPGSPSRTRRPPDGLDSLAGPARRSRLAELRPPGAGRGRRRGRGRGVAAPGGRAGGAEGGCRAEGSGPQRREGRPSPGSGAPRWDWFLRSHFLSNQTADWRREPTRAALEVCVSLRPMIAPKPTPL